MEFVLSVNALQVGSVTHIHPYGLLSVSRVRVRADSLMLPVLGCRPLRAREGAMRNPGGKHLTSPRFLPPEEKKAAGGGPVRLRSTSRKDSISEDEMVLRERSYDYQFRYCGHCNTTTDIKEANFFGRSEALNRRRVHITIGSRSWWGGATREV